MSMYKNLTTICAAAALALGLAACGGGGGGSGNQADMTPPPDPTPPPMEYDVALPAGHGLADGMTTIDAGETVMLSSGTYLTCPGPGDCTLTVSTDGVTGASSASSTGGMVAITTEATRMAAAREAERQLHLEHQNTLSAAETELARVQALYDAGDATANELAAAQKAVDDAMMLAGNIPPPPPPDPEPVVVAASGSVTHDALQDAFIGVLPDPGDSDSFVIPAGGTAVRQGVTFACNSERDCTITVTNSLDTIVATWMSYDVDAAEAMVVASVPADPLLMDPLHPDLTLNPSNVASVQAIIDVAIGAPAADPAPEGARTNVNTAIGGLDLDGFGVEDMSKLTLTSDLDVNVADYDSTATPPTGGSTLEVPRDLRSEHADRTALDGWAHSKVLFADWGDTAGSGDGGYETAALLYSDHEAPTAEAFDGDLAGKLAHRGSWFTLNADGAVAIDAAAANAADRLARTELTVGGAQLSTLSTGVTDTSTHEGTYFGASGTYTCTTGCTIEREETGTVPFNISAGTWTFTPDADQTVTIPDQDYMVFGAWLTVPDDADNGEHRIGVFYDGMREYGTVGVDLEGTATYTGGAAGVYRDRTASGMFTADATLTADFGDETAQGMLSGRIDNFRNSNGVFLGTDTAASPNDPATGGENDWVVTLTGAADNTSTGTVTGAGVAGSADGVAWTGGEWTAQFYGTSGSTPSGVAGQFRAMSAERGVVGAFGAMHQPPADE